MDYPFTAKQVPIDEAIRFVAKIVYPEKDERTRVKRTRARVEYAISKGVLRRLRRDAGDRVEALDFFTWAASSKGWAALYQVPNLPIRPATAKMMATFPSPTASGIGTSIPTDRAELEQAFQDLNVRHCQFQQDHERLQREVSNLTTEVERWREKRASVSAKMSAAAKKPRSR